MRENLRRSARKVVTALTPRRSEFPRSLKDDHSHDHIPPTPRLRPEDLEKGLRAEVCRGGGGVPTAGNRRGSGRGSEEREREREEVNGREVDGRDVGTESVARHGAQFPRDDLTCPRFGAPEDTQGDRLME